MCFELGALNFVIFRRGVVPTNTKLKAQSTKLTYVGNVQQTPS